MDKQTTVHPPKGPVPKNIRTDINSCINMDGS